MAGAWSLTDQRALQGRKAKAQGLARRLSLLRTAQARMARTWRKLPGSGPGTWSLRTRWPWPCRCAVSAAARMQPCCALSRHASGLFSGLAAH